MPEYVKYMTDTERFFVKSTNSAGEEQTFETGSSPEGSTMVYTRTWNKDTLQWDYEQVGMMAGPGIGDMFTYGATSDDYGTKEISASYSVPMQIPIYMNSGRQLTADFAGYNMQLWSRHMYLDLDAGGVREGAVDMARNQNRFTGRAYTYDDSVNIMNRPVRWSSSCIRQWLNYGSTTGLPAQDDEIKYAFYLDNSNGWYQAAVDGYINYPIRHTFVEKAAANGDAFLQNVCSQVNRTWFLDWTQDANYTQTLGEEGTEWTADRFWLPGCDLLRTETLKNNQYLGEKHDTNIGLCEEPAFAKHLLKEFSNGCQGYYNMYTLRSPAGKSYAGSSWQNFGPMTVSTASTSTGAVAIDTVYGALGYKVFGVAPACTIG